GMEQDLKTDPPCHPRACAIQGMRSRLISRSDSVIHIAADCIQKNGYDESKCQKQVRSQISIHAHHNDIDRTQIDALYECCNAFYEKNGDSASTVSCPKAGLLRLKMRQRAQDIQ
ncbi:unnamed protein product, partial [Aureobasidium vineae]